VFATRSRLNMPWWTIQIPIVMKLVA